MVSPCMPPSLFRALYCPLLHDILISKDEEDLEVESFVPVLLHDLLKPSGGRCSVSSEPRRSQIRLMALHPLSIAQAAVHDQALSPFPGYPAQDLLQHGRFWVQHRRGTVVIVLEVLPPFG